MSGVLIGFGLLALYAWWQPSFINEISIKRLLQVEPVTAEVADISLNRKVPTQHTSEAPAIIAKAAGVYDSQSRLQLLTKEADHLYPIASITKLMTAMVALDLLPDLNSIYKITEADYRAGAKAHFFTGDHVRVKDLLQTSLIASDNTAIIALVHSTGLTEEEFVKKMNEKAQQLRWQHTIFFDATGLDSRNESTVREIARLASTAFTYAEIKDSTRLPKYEAETKEGRLVTVFTTNSLLTNETIGDNISMVAGKTGHVPEAGYCFVGWFSKDNHDIITVVLGAPDEDSRFTETKKLALWAYNAYTW